MEILVKRHSDIQLPEKVASGDWVDLRAADYDIKTGDYGIIRLGVSMKLPKGYGGILAPRSSLFLRTGLLQSNSVGVFENSYCGDEDEWGFPYLATRDVYIHKGDRVCQFMVYPLQPSLTFVEVEHLPDSSRGGFGSTGVN